MSEPIEYCGELHKAEIRLGELVVAGADPTVTFDPAVELFDLMAS